MIRKSVTVAIVNYKTPAELRACLHSLRRVRDEADLRIVVTDNHSGDGSVAMLNSEFPDVLVIANQENRGFAAAVNQAFETCKSEFFFVLNPDTWVARGAISRLLEVIDGDERIAVVGAQVTEFSGDTIQSVFSAPSLPKEFLNLWPELKSLLVPRWIRTWYRKARISTPPPYEVQAISGAAMLIRSSVFREQGGLDPQFFLYHEEVDFCLRLGKAGYKILAVPAAQVLHHDARASGFKVSALPREPVLGWRTKGKWLLFAHHGTEFQRRGFVALTGMMLAIRRGGLRVRAALALKSRPDLAARCTELRNTVRNLNFEEAKYRSQAVAARPHS